MFNVFTLIFLGLSLCINLVEGNDDIKISNLKKARVCLHSLLWEDVCFVFLETASAVARNALRFII